MYRTVVLNVDKKNERFSLVKIGRRSLAKACNACPVGKPIEGKIIAVDAAGATVDLGLGVEGFLSAKEFDREPPKVDGALDAEVTGHDEKERRIILSVRQYLKHAQKRDLEEFRAKQGEARATLSDVMRKE
jgi:small subunit ribosomal protein S1